MVCQQDDMLTHDAISLVGTLLCAGKLRFCCHIRHPKLAGLRYLGLLQTKENATAHSKMGSLKQTIQQECNRKEQLCCSEIAMCSHCSLRRLLLLAAAKVFSSQEIILKHLGLEKINKEVIQNIYTKFVLLHRVTAHPVISKIIF
jgi:hypothetical protein